MFLKLSAWNFQCYLDTFIKIEENIAYTSQYGHYFFIYDTIKEQIEEDAK